MNIFYYRKHIIFISQVIGSIFCIYFILNVQRYEISAPLLNYFFPSITLKINSIITSIGTLFLVLPLTIIILSMLHPESYRLKIASSFFGVASTLITLFKGWWQDTLGDYYNFKIVLVSRIYTLEEKRVYLKQALINIIEDKYKHILEQYNYLQDTLLNNYVEIYDIKLNQLPNHNSIVLYAGEIIQNKMNKFLNNKSMDLDIRADYLATAAKLIFFLGLTVTVVFVGFAIYRFFSDGGALKEGAELAKGTAEIAAHNTDNVISTQNIIADLVPAVTNHAIATSVAIGTQLSDVTLTGFEKVNERILILEKVTLGLKQTQDEIFSQVTHLKKIVNDYLT
jgi:hypothetical protein